MNEQFKELAIKAANQHGHTIKFSDEITETLGTFAKFIVEECVAVVKDKTDTTHAYTTFDLNMIQATIGKSVSAIRDHFGDK